jgi:hypothetical protein
MHTNVQQVYLVCRDSVIQQKTTAKQKNKSIKNNMTTHMKKKNINSQKNTLKSGKKYRTSTMKRKKKSFHAVKLTEKKAIPYFGG